jgi:hypothetical protein
MNKPSNRLFRVNFREQDQNMHRINKFALSITAAVAVTLAASGCAHHTAANAPPPSVQNTAASFQPYVMVNQPPPPAPKVAIPGHRTLRLVKNNSRVYLADKYGHAYEVGRDSRGNVYPVYQDTVTNQYFPLYYDRDRDSYYRVACNDGSYYRNYVDDPDGRPRTISR